MNNKTDSIPHLTAGYQCYDDAKRPTNPLKVTNKGMRESGEVKERITQKLLQSSVE